ncbi:MAG: VOC family protein [Planctomycetota bacterium]
MSLRLGLVQINVPDIAKARAFYVTQLGLPCRQPHGVEGPLEVDLGDDATLLLYAVDKVAPATYETQRVTLVMFTDNLEQQMAQWSSRGVEFQKVAWSTQPSGVGECPYGNFIAFQDPFGNVWELLEPTERRKPATVAGKRGKK